MTNNILINIYRDVLRVRSIENKIVLEYPTGEMRCPIHLSIGQEATPVGICKNLREKDLIVSAHRSHAHYLAKGGSLKKMISELYGKVTGCAKGKGGSMHLIDIKAGVVAAVPIVGSTIPIGTGLAWGNKLKKNNKIVVVFFGDGATEEGVFQESLDFASLHQLKILFVCENNYYSVYSSLKFRQSKKRDLLKFSESLGVNSHKLDGNDVIKIFNESKKILEDIRKNKGPALVLLDTYRWLEHCGPNNDDMLNYRSKKEVASWLKKCPLKKIEKFLLKKKIINEKIMKKMLLEIDTEIEDAFNYARRSPFPKFNSLNQDIYSK